MDGSNETDIADATEMTYTTTTDDIDKSIKVTASFTDDDGYPEQRSSSPVGPITALTCTAPDLGGRVEVWRAILTVGTIIVSGRASGEGYVEGSVGALSDTSFEFDSRTATVTRVATAFNGDLIMLIDVEFDPTTDQEFIDVEGLPTLQSLQFHVCDKAVDISAGSARNDGVEWDATKTGGINPIVA